jgi:glutathione S-transferase
MKLYGHPMSTCTRKVLCTLAEKGQKADFVLVDIMKGDGKQPDHLARQPFGQVPAIDDDGFQLYESRAIIRYLDAKLPGAQLSPSDLKGRATMDQWLSVEQSNFTPAAMKIIWNLFFNPMMGKPSDDKLVEESIGTMNRALDVMQARLDKSAFLAGDQFTLAEISFAPYIEYLAQTKAISHVNDRPAVAKWWKNVSGRKSWQTAIGKDAG